MIWLPISGGGTMAALVVGPRRDGRPHDPRSISDLEELLALVAAAARLGGERTVDAPMAADDRPDRASA